MSVNLWHYFLKAPECKEENMRFDELCLEGEGSSHEFVLTHFRMYFPLPPDLATDDLVGLGVSGSHTWLHLNLAIDMP